VRTGPSDHIADLVAANGVDIGIVLDFEPRPGLHVDALGEYALSVVVYPEHPLAARSGEHLPGRPSEAHPRVPPEGRGRLAETPPRVLPEGEERSSQHQASARFTETGDIVDEYSHSTEAGLSVADLAGQTMVLMQVGTNLRGLTDRILDSGSVEPLVAMELDNVESIKKMIAARLGISVLPQIAVVSEVEWGTLVSLPLDGGMHRRQIAAVTRDDKYVSSAMKAFVRILRDTCRSESSRQSGGTRLSEAEGA